MSSYWDRVRNPRCRECPLHEQANRVCAVTGKGSVKANVLFVGEAPGADEERRGLPFVGRSGRLMTDLLEEADWGLPFAITNAVWCRPPNNRPPSKKEWSACAALHLHKAIQRVAPKLIICWGATAAKAVNDDAKLTLRKARRRVFEVEKSVRSKARRGTKRRQRIKVVCTYHPAAVLRSPTLRGVVVEDLRYFLRILSGAVVEEKESDRVYHLLGTDEGFHRDFGDGATASVDIESTTLSPWDDGAKLLTCAVSTAPLEATAFAVGKNASSDRLAELLADPGVAKIGHNLKFDLVWLKKNGYEISGKLFDTQVAFRLIDENYPDTTLQHLAERFTSMGDYAGDMKEERGAFTEVTEDLLRYNAGDADATYRLSKLFKNRLRMDKLRRPMRLAMETLRTLVDVELAGMHVDQEELEILFTHVRKKRGRYKRFLRRNFPDLNPKSVPQVRELLFDKMELKSHRHTKGGTPSTDEATLKALKARTHGLENKTIRALLGLRKWNKVRSGFLVPLRDKHLRWDGRVHPVYHLASAVTGRLSCSDPNIQQVPKSLRSLFVSRWEQGKIIEADFSQMELRVLAYVSRDPTMLDVFESGGDIHTSTAARICGVDPSDITEKQRYDAKTVNFGVIYGMQVGALVHQTGMDWQEAQAFLAEYWRTYPRVKKWISRTKRHVLLHGYVKSLFGRKRRLHIEEPDTKEGEHMLRQAVNFPIQYDAASITLLCMNTLHRMMDGMRSQIIGTVHDSILFDATAGELDELLILIDEVCSRPDLSTYKIDFDVPLEVDLKVGDNWRDVEKV